MVQTRKQPLYVAVISMVSCAMALMAPLSVFGRDLLLSGEVYSRQAQEVIVPMSNTFNARISEMAEEGSLVHEGDIVVKFDGSEGARQLEQQQETNRREQAKTKGDLVKLEKELAQAEFALQKSELALELAAMEAAIPGDLIGALEHAENQLTHEQAIKDFDGAKKALDDKRKAMAERKNQAELDARKNQNTERWWQQMLDSFTIRAKQPGYMIYGTHPWTRAKFQEGDSVQTSFKIAQVASTDDLGVRVYINGIDRPKVRLGQEVKIYLDTQPGKELRGRLVSISDSGSNRSEWGEAMYFEGLVEFSQETNSGMLPGMSVRVELQQ